MELYKKIFKNWTIMVSLVGCILVFGIVASGMESMYLLVVLGAMNVCYGIYGIKYRKPAFKSTYQDASVIPKQSPEYFKIGGFFQLLLGCFIFLMAMIYILQIFTSDAFWNILFLGIVLLLISGYIARKRIGAGPT